jgi:hypothetical protein
VPPPIDANFLLDKVRLLYDRDQSTARLIVKNKDDLEQPLVRPCSPVIWFSFPTTVWCIGYDPLFLASDESYSSQMSGTSIVHFWSFSSASLDLGNMGVRASMSVVSTAGVSGGDRFMYLLPVDHRI